MQDEKIHSNVSQLDSIFTWSVLQSLRELRVVVVVVLVMWCFYLQEPLTEIFAKYHLK